MVTGYDHLLFLVGVIFFLYLIRDIVQYVRLFTIGQSVTLLAGVLGGIHADPDLIEEVHIQHVGGLLMTSPCTMNNVSLFPP